VSTHQMLQGTSATAPTASKGTPTWKMGAKISMNVKIQIGIRAMEFAVTQ